MEVGEWVQVSLGIFSFGKSAQNQFRYFGVVYHYSVCIHCKKLLVIIMLVFCPCQRWVSKKSLDWGWVGFILDFLNFFNFAKPLKKNKSNFACKSNPFAWQYVRRDGMASLAKMFRSC